MQLIFVAVVVGIMVAIPRLVFWAEEIYIYKECKDIDLMYGMPENSKAYYPNLSFGELLKEVFDTYADIARTGSLSISDESTLKRLLEYADEDGRLPYKEAYRHRFFGFTK